MLMRLSIRALVVALSACAVGAAAAANLQVAPVSLALMPQQQAEALWLSNSSAQALTAQVRVFAWTQHDGVERLEPTGDIILSPPLTEVTAGARQLVRVVRTDPTAPLPSHETAYRLIVDELPLARADGTSGVSFVMRYSIPLFVAGSAPDAVPALRTRWRQDGTTLQLEVHNDGDQRAQLADLHCAGDVAHLHAGLLGYALARSTMRWSLPAAIPADCTLSATVNGRPQPLTTADAPTSSVSATPAMPPHAPR